MLSSPHAALFLVAASTVAAFPGRSRHHWLMDNLPQLRLKALQGEVAPAPRYVTQPQDHFDSSNTNTWQQAYYVNDTFWKPGSDAPVFLCVGGEGPPIDGTAVVNSLHCNVAVEWMKEKQALMFAIEHRYFGCHNMSACPVTNFKNQKEALKYHSSHQAIEDNANFVKTINKLYSLSSKNKWVTFGGSYPGMLAGWTRLRHPELIHAAVASSAPVHAKLDMFEYNDYMAKAYTVSDNNVGGSPDCQQAIRTGHAMVEDMLKTPEGIASLENMLGFKKDDLNTTEKQQNQLGSGAAYFPGQENDPACTEDVCNIKKICEIMVDDSHGDELQRIVAIRKKQNITLSAFDEPEDNSNSTLPDFWYWQTCTEFGFYQTCMPGSDCMFPQITDVAFMVAQCDRDWGIDVSSVADSIAATNKHYGALTPFDANGKLGSCVLWPNGEVDPWATLSVLKSPSPQMPVMWVDGASHHAWTHPTLGSDQASVVKARSQIRHHVEEFLKSDCSESAIQEVIV